MVLFFLSLVSNTFVVVCLFLFFCFFVVFFSSITNMCFISLNQFVSLNVSAHKIVNATGYPSAQPFALVVSGPSLVLRQRCPQCRAGFKRPCAIPNGKGTFLYTLNSQRKGCVFIHTKPPTERVRCIDAHSRSVTHSVTLRGTNTYHRTQ